MTPTKTALGSVHEDRMLTHEPRASSKYLSRGRPFQKAPLAVGSYQNILSGSKEASARSRWYTGGSRIAVSFE